MASGSKLFPRTKNRIGTKFFVDTFFFFCSGAGLRRPKKCEKITMMARVSKLFKKPNKTIGKKKFHPSKFWPKKCSGKRARLFFFFFFFSETYSGKETRNRNQIDLEINLNRNRLGW